MKILRKLISELEAKLPAPQPSSEGMLVDEPAQKYKVMSKKELREEKKRLREETKESSFSQTKKSRKT
jgi:hypothetical protein